MQIPGPSVEVPEIPWQSRVELPARSSAVIVVDMQNDFVKEGGSLVVPGAAATLVCLQSLLARARQAGVPIAYTQDSHFAGDPEWEIWPRHCEVDSWGWEIVEEVAPQQETWSARRAATTASMARGWSITWPMYGRCATW